MINLIISSENTNLYEGIIPGEGLVRRILPAKNHEPTLEEFQQGIPYGLPFKEIVQPSEDFSARVEVVLHNAGIWTIDDLRTKGKIVTGALQNIYSIELVRIIQAAELYLSSKPVKPKSAKKESEV